MKAHPVRTHRTAAPRPGRRLWLLCAAALPAALPPASAPARQPAAVEEVVVVGSRRAPRSVLASAVPVDVISSEDQANTDMDDLLRALVPGYNVTVQPISDGATMVRPANLRGLPPDNTLVLVNNKRRHRSAIIAFLDDGVSKGSQGPDVSVFPRLALKNIEVLRDGASAQYGSDAIAGVLNFSLRDDSSGGSLEAVLGEYEGGDGASMTYMGNIGLPLTDAGFANFSFEYREADLTSESVQKDVVAQTVAGGNANIPDPAQIWGLPEIKSEFKTFANLGLDLDGGGHAYAFGNWAERTVEGGFFFRDPLERAGVYTPSGEDFRQRVLVADLTAGSNDDGIACPEVPIAPVPGTSAAAGAGGTLPGLAPDPQALAAVAADPNCFALIEFLPHGFRPRFGGDVADTSITAGVRGELGGGWRYDLSASAGQNKVDFKIRRTINPSLVSLRENMPMSFAPGGYTQTERALNMDVSREFEAGLASPVGVAAGVEVREEFFEIRAGDPNSWAVNKDINDQGFLVGSNGFAGFKPADEGEFGRSSHAVYVDVEADATDALLLGVAVRYENYEGFSATTNGKIAARLQLTDGLAVRGAVSTGFRAPTAGQVSVRNVTTNLALLDNATLPPTHPIAARLGGKPLEIEEAVNMTFGLIAQYGGFSMTADYFNIKVSDRIALSAPARLSQQDKDELESLGFPDAQSFANITFFTNDFDTTTEGIDVVASGPIAPGAGGDTSYTIVYNWTDTAVDSFNPVNISPSRVMQLEGARPAHRASATVSHLRGAWRGFVRANYFGETFEVHLDEEDAAGRPLLPVDLSAKTTIDVEVGWESAGGLSLAAGAQNLLGERPDENPWRYITAARYPITAPFGFDGRFHYLRAAYAF